MCICPWEKERVFRGLCNLQEHRAIRGIQISLALIGIILNSIVLGVYVKRKNIQKKPGNVLLAGQAVVDLFNTLLFAIPDALIFIYFHENYQHTNLDDEKAFYVTIYVLFPFSFFSSIFTFTFIAIERYLSIAKPMWHRRNVTKGWILKWFVVDFIAVIVFTVLTAVMVTL